MHENDFLDDAAVAHRRTARQASEPGSPDLELPSQLGNREFVRQVVGGAFGSAAGDVAGSSRPGAGTGASAPGTQPALGARPAVLRSAERSQGAGPLDPEIEGDIRSAQGGGRPLDEHVRGGMEGHLGVDLSGVRVHADSQGDALSRSVQADAFTTGSDVFFGSGKYSPDSSDGRKLLAHELTHVAQQAAGDVPDESRVSHPDDSHEREAASVADMIASAPATAPAGAEASGGPGLLRVASQEELDEEEMVSRQAGPEEELEEEDLSQGTPPA